MTDAPDGTSYAALAGKRTLVVEDEFLITLDIIRVLESAYMAEPVTVSRNSDALTRLQGERFDLAILDLKLNSENSFPVAERLEELVVPFIFLTGASVMMVPSRFRTAPVVTKPFDSEALLNALRAAIERG